MNLNIVIILLFSLNISLFLLFRQYFQKKPYAIIINKSEKKCRIDLEIADSPEKWEKGLMHRKNLPDNSGMIFVFEKPHRIAFWMKDTLIPLDIIVISSDLFVIEFKKNLVPMSEELITSDELTTCIIEVNGGYSERNGIGIGDKVILDLIE